MSNKNSDWESYLFSPPPWPYEDNDSDAPAAHLTHTNYGYNVRELDSMPVQAGYEHPIAGLNSEGMSKRQAKQYYSQYEVFRNVMLDKNWASLNEYVQHNTDDDCKSSRPHRTAASFRHRKRSGHIPRRNSTLSPSQRYSPYSNEQMDGIRLPQMCDSQRHRSSSESTKTAVSSGYSTDMSSDVDISESSDDNIDIPKVAEAAIQTAKAKAKARLNSASLGRSFMVLRAPLIGVVLFVITLELITYFAIRYMVRLYEDVLIWRGRRGLIFAHLCHTKSYQEYMNYARLLDAKLGIKLSESSIHSRYCDSKLLERITQTLRRSRGRIEKLQKGDRNIGFKQGSAGSDSSSADEAYEATISLCDLLRQGPLKANAGGWENREVWSRAYSGTDYVIDKYIEEVVISVDCVRNSSYLPAAEKLAFFRQAAKQQGRTALCLSGGAAMGWKHLGVARCLLDEARLPRVISGTSAGALVAAMLATHTDDELRVVLRPEIFKYMTACQGSVPEKLMRWLIHGHYFDAVEWVPRAQVFTRGNLTFLEAFQRTGKILNIPCTPIGHKYSPPKLMNYISAPNVIIWSAVMASACIPGVMQPMVLLMKTRNGTIKPYIDSGALWRDGSFRNDIPSADLRASFNVKSTVVSQVNPHIALFFYDRDGSIGQPPARRYSSVWRGGFILSAIEHALKLDIRKWLRLLSDLNLIPLMLNQDWTYVWLQKFDGNITIIPKWRFTEYFKLLLDPTLDSLTQSMDAGKRATWPKLKIIKMRQKVEDAITAGWLESYYACIRNGQQAQSLPPRLALAAARMGQSMDYDALNYGELADDKTALRALCSLRARSSSPTLVHLPIADHVLRRTGTALARSRQKRSTAYILGFASVGQRTKKPYTQLAIQGGVAETTYPHVDHFSSLEDVWTG